MPEEQTLTPSEGERDTVTSGTGTENGSGEQGSSEGDSSLSFDELMGKYETVKRQYSASTSEAQRLADENAKKDTQNQQLRSLLGMAAQRMKAEKTGDGVVTGAKTPMSVDEPLMTVEELQQRSDAEIRQDFTTVQRLDALKEARQEARILDKQERARATSYASQTRAQGAINYVENSPELRDANHPISRKAAQRYQEKVVAGHSHEDADWRGFNPYVLKEALMEVRLEELEKSGGSGGGSPTTTEGSQGRGSASQSSSAAESPEWDKYLTATEKTYVESVKKHDPSYSRKKHWENMRPEIKEQRKGER